MKRNLDFMLYADDDIRIKFRFYPRSSSYCVFNPEAPVDERKVYKVYYSWAILASWNISIGDEGKIWESYDRMFYMDWDEDSALNYLGNALEDFLDNDSDEPMQTLKIYTFGQPGSDWRITRIKRDKVYLDFEVFDNFTNRGYRFTLDENSAKDFIRYVKKVNRYMAEHAEAI